MPDIFPSSPADGTHTFDDFHSNSATSTGLLGSLDWLRTTINNASTATFVASQNGVMRLVTAGALNDGEAVYLMADKVTLANGNGVIIRFRVRLGTTITGNNFRIGLDDSVTATDGVVGIFVVSNEGVLTFDVASSNGDQTKTVTGVTTLTSGTTMVVNTWHDIELKLSGTNSNGGPDQIDCFVDGEPAGSIKNSLLGSTETMEYKIVHWDTSGGGTAQVFEIDYYEVYIPRAH